MSAAAEAEHAYGPRVRILSNPFLATALARLSSTNTAQLELLGLVRTVYTGLLIAALEREFPCVQAEIETRMAPVHGAAGVWRGEALDPAVGVVVCDVVRAGIVPAQVCFELLLQVLPSAQVRLDHVNVARRAGLDGRVEGAELLGSKIGGSAAGKLLILPDPMGATGATTQRVLDHYMEFHGRPAAILALPMIATPEYLRAVLAHDPALRVVAARLDRGLSPPAVLRALPGVRWDEERGLDETGYIVPGAGGLGEVLNNAWC